MLRIQLEKVTREDDTGLCTQGTLAVLNTKAYTSRYGETYLLPPHINRVTLKQSSGTSLLTPSSTISSNWWLYILPERYNSNKQTSVKVCNTSPTQNKVVRSFLVVCPKHKERTIIFARQKLLRCHQTDYESCRIQQKKKQENWLTSDVVSSKGLSVFFLQVGQIHPLINEVCNQQELHVYILYSNGATPIFSTINRRGYG